MEAVVPVSEDDETTYALQNDRSRASEERPPSSTNSQHPILIARDASAVRDTQGVPNATTFLWPSTDQQLETSLPPSQPYLSPEGRISEGSAAPTERSHTIDGIAVQKGDACVWLFACSQDGITWVCETTASRAFAKIAEGFSRSTEHRFSTRTLLGLNTTRAEPAEETAWEYVNAFFDNCWEARLGFIHRPDFEAQLQAHFHKGVSDRHDCAEVALRNVIFAAGYRAILAKSAGVSFDIAQRKAWQGYFKNALSVLTGLLLSPSRLMAVQALALMACYVEGLGSPEIQRVLCHNAVHTAVTQGLHLETDHRMNSSSDDSLKKAWLWWGVYALEKHLSFTSGRPSMIDDYMISVSTPSKVPSESNMDLDALTLAARHAKICSRILREIMSNKAWTASADELQKVVNEIDQQLKSLLDDFPQDLRVGMLAKLSEETHPMAHHFHTLYLYFSVQGSLLAVHSHFFYPWLLARLSGSNSDRVPDAVLDAQVSFSSNTVAEAARKILLAVRTMTSNVATPTWLAITYPIYAHLSLLIHVLKHPTMATVSADLGVLDICAGHFGFIDFMTSSAISVSLPRESVNLAAKAVKAAKKTHDKDQTAGASYLRSRTSCGLQF